MNASQAKTKALEISAEWLLDNLKSGLLRKNDLELPAKDIDRVRKEIESLANTFLTRYWQRRNSGKLIGKGRGRPPKTRKGYARAGWEVKRLREQWELLKPRRKGKIFIIQGLYMQTNLSHADLRLMVSRAEVSWPPEWNEGEWGGKIE